MLESIKPFLIEMGINVEKLEDWAAINDPKIKGMIEKRLGEMDYALKRYKNVYKLQSPEVWERYKIMFPKNDLHEQKLLVEEKAKAKLVLRSIMKELHNEIGIALNHVPEKDRKRLDPRSPETGTNENHR